MRKQFRLPVHVRWIDRTARVGACVVLVAAGSIVAACGSSDSESSGGASASEATTTSNSGPKLSGAPVKAMTIAPLSGKVALFPAFEWVAKAYQQHINGNGGIGGRPLEVVICDTKGISSGVAACAQQAKQDGVVALVGSFTLDGPTLIPLLSKAKIPWVSPAPISAPEYSDPISFPFTFGLGPVVGQAVHAGRSPNCKNIGLVVMDIPSKDFQISLMQSALKSVGHAPLSTITTVPATVGGDLSAPAAQAIGKDTNCLMHSLAEGNYPAFLGALKQTGWTGTLYGPQGNLNKGSFKGLGDWGAGAIDAGGFQTIDSPAYADYRAALKAVDAPSDIDFNSLAGLGSWVTWVGFEKIAAPIKDLTNVTFIDALDKTDHLVTGLVPPIDFTSRWKGLGGGFPRVFDGLRVATLQVYEGGDFRELPPDGNKFLEITNALEGKPFGEDTFLPVE